MSAYDRPLPHDDEAEKATVGSMLLGGRPTINDVRVVLTGGPDEFADEKNRAIYGVLLTMAGRSDLNDLACKDEHVLRDALEAAGKWERVGKYSGPADCINSVSSHLRAVAFAGMVHKKYLLRSLIVRTHEIQSRAFQANGDADSVLDFATTELAALAKLRTPPDPEHVLGLRITNTATVTPTSVKWVWKPRIPQGKLTVIAGDPKLGKSILAIDIAARVSAGVKWPDRQDDSRPEPARVLLLTAEDDIADTVVPRLIAAGANLDNVDILESCIDPQSDTPRQFAIDTDTARLGTLLAKTPYAIAIIDPLTAYMGSVDSHVNAQVRGALAPLAKIAAEYRCAVVGISHLNKSATTERMLYRVMGSLGFTAAARSVWGVTRDRELPERRLLLNAGCNNAKDVGGLVFEVRPCRENPAVPVLAWEAAPVLMDADAGLAAQSARHSEPTALDNAKAFLSEALADGPAPADRIMRLGTERGLNTPTLHRARKALGVVAKQDRNAKGVSGWTLTLPGTGGEPC